MKRRKKEVEEEEGSAVAPAAAAASSSQPLIILKCEKGGWGCELGFWENHFWGRWCFVWSFSFGGGVE